MTTPGIYDRKTFAPGKVMIHPGDEPHDAFLIQSGKAVVFHEVDGKFVEVATVGPGEIIGDMALIRKSKHRSGVKALDAVVAVVVSADHLEKILSKSDPLVRTILDGMIKRIDRMNSKA